MTKSYTEELAAWVEKRTKKKRRQDAAAVAFVAVKPEVIAAIEAGYALTTIWEHMHETGKVKCSYETFRKHVRRFIRSPSVSPATPPTLPNPKEDATKKTAKEKTSTEPLKSEPAGVSRFTYNPTMDDKDLF